MQNKFLSRLLTAFTLACVYSFTLVQPVLAQTQTWAGVCVFENDPSVATIQGLQCLLANILSVAITIIGLAGFVMIIFGAFRYLLSGGNAKETEQAKNTLTYSVIGLVLALAAFIVLNLLARFTGVNTILNFQIPYSSQGF